MGNKIPPKFRETMRNVNMKLAGKSTVVTCWDLIPKVPFKVLSFIFFFISYKCTLTYQTCVDQIYVFWICIQSFVKFCSCIEPSEPPYHSQTTSTALIRDKKEQLQAHLTADWRPGTRPCTIHTHTHRVRILLSHYVTLICQRAPSALRWGFLLSTHLFLSSCFSSNSPHFHPSPPPLSITLAHFPLSFKPVTAQMNRVLTKCTCTPQSQRRILKRKTQRHEPGRRCCHRWYTVLLQLWVTDPLDYIQHVILLIHLSSRQSRNKKQGHFLRIILWNMELGEGHSIGRIKYYRNWATGRSLNHQRNII